MQSEDYTSNHRGRGRFGSNQRRAAVIIAILFLGLAIGGLAGAWSVSDINEFMVMETPILPPQDPHITVLDKFEGMWVLPCHTFGEEALY